MKSTEAITKDLIKIISNTIFETFIDNRIWDTKSIKEKFHQSVKLLKKEVENGAFSEKGYQMLEKFSKAPEMNLLKLELTSPQYLGLESISDLYQLAANPDHMWKFNSLDQSSNAIKTRQDFFKKSIDKINKKLMKN